MLEKDEIILLIVKYELSSQNFINQYILYLLN